MFTAITFHLNTILLVCFTNSYFNGALFCQYCKVQLFQPIVLFWEKLVINPAILQFSLFCWILNFFPLLYSPFTTQMPKDACSFLMYLYTSFRSYMFLRCLFKLLCVFSSPFPIVLTQTWIFLPSFRIFTVDLVFLVF